MRDWVLFILKNNYRLNTLVACEDRLISSLASSHSRASLDDFLSVIDRINRKSALINLRVLFNSFRDSLSHDIFTSLQQFASGASLRDIADSLNIPKWKLARAVNYAIAKCCRKLLSLGFSKERFENEYFDLIEEGGYFG